MQIIHNFSKWNSSYDVINDCRKNHCPKSWENCKKIRYPSRVKSLPVRTYGLLIEKSVKPFYVGTKETFIVTLLTSQYDLDTFEKDIEHRPDHVVGIH